MKGLAPQPRPDPRRVSWTALRFLAFCLFMVVVFMVGTVGAGWLVKRWGGPPWLMASAGCAVGWGVNRLVNAAARWRRW